MVTRSITVNEDLRWSVQVHGKPLDRKKCSALTKSVPEIISTKPVLNLLLKLVDSLNVCAGHPDQHFLELADSCKGIFQSANKTTVAFVDDYYPVQLNGGVHTDTIRTTACELLVHGSKCNACKQYRATLRSPHSRKVGVQRSDGTNVSSHVNIRYLRTPEKRQRISNLKTAVDSKAAEVIRKTQQIKQLKSRLRKATEQHGICIEEELEKDLTKLMVEKTEEIC